jgi:hypothetical protein
MLARASASRSAIPAVIRFFAYRCKITVSGRQPERFAFVHCNISLFRCRCTLQFLATNGLYDAHQQSRGTKHPDCTRD